MQTETKEKKILMYFKISKLKFTIQIRISHTTTVIIQRSLKKKEDNSVTFTPLNLLSLYIKKWIMIQLFRKINPKDKLSHGF